MYALWKKNTRVFKNGMNYDIQKPVKNFNFISTHQVSDIVENKDRDIWTKEEK